MSEQTGSSEAPTAPELTERSAEVIVASTSAAAGTNADLTGPQIVSWLRERGFTVPEARVVADGPPVGDALRNALDLGASVVITTGGTGVSPTDLTPKQTLPLVDVQLPGVIDAIRRRGEQNTPFAALTRGIAGFAGNTFVINLPGSRGGVRDGLAVLDPILEHLLDQRAGAHEADAHGRRE